MTTMELIGKGIGHNCLSDAYDLGRADAIEKFNDKVNYLKGQYVDACNMCTKIECDVCAVNSIIEDLEQLKEQNK